MKIKVLVITVLCVLSIASACSGQESKKVETMFKTLKSLADKGEDTGRVKVCLQLINVCQSNPSLSESPVSKRIEKIANGNIQDAGIDFRRMDWFQQFMSYCEDLIISSLQESERNGDYLCQASGYYALGHVFYISANRTEALKNWQKSFDRFGKIGSSLGMMHSSHYIAFGLAKLGDYQASIETYQRTHDIAKILGDRYEMSQSLFGMAEQYHRIGEFHLARANLEGAKAIFDEVGHYNGIANYFHTLADIYFDEGNYEQSMKNYQLAVEHFNSISNYAGAAGAIFCLGKIHQAQGNYVSALDLYHKALKQGEETNYLQMLPYCYEKIAAIYELQGDEDQALKNYLACLEICEKIKFKTLLASSYTNIGRLYLSHNRFVESRNYLRQGLEIAIETGSRQIVCEAYMNLGHACFKQDSLASALQMYQTALGLAEDLSAKNEIGIARLNMGKCFVEMGQFREAKENLLIALEFSNEIGARKNVVDAYLMMSQLENISGNYKEALENHKLYTAYRDSLFNETNSKVLAQFQTVYETDRKDKEIKILENEKQISDLELQVKQESLIRVQAERDIVNAQNLFQQQQIDLMAKERELQECALEQNQNHLLVKQTESARQLDQLNLLNKEGVIHKMTIRKQTVMRNYLVAVLGLVLLVTFLLYRNYTTRQQLKLQALRNKISSDLHDDVGSTLSSIYIFSEMARQQSKEVIPMLDTIGESSKKMLDAMADIVWTINPENDDLEKIIDRMRSFAYELLRAKNIDFQFEADEELHQMKLPMEVRKNLYLIFKEATNNMVKYANADKAYFSLKEENKNLTMVVRDNGRGFDVTKPSAGNGLRSMQKRAKEIGGELRIESAPQLGTMLQLKVAV